jgi:deoxyadenosine/deoxycytidine kinase
MIYTIDANIGAGKTTILEKLHKEYKYLIDLEPVEQWKPYLKNMYENNTGYNDFQVKVWSDRAWIQKKNENNLFIERSSYFTRHTFIESLYDTKKLTNKEYENLNIMYDRTENMWTPDKYIYIQVKPDTCYNRIGLRNRESEIFINLTYLRDLHKRHEETYKKAKNEGKDIICINGDRPVEQVVKDIIQNIQ